MALWSGCLQGCWLTPAVLAPAGSQWGMSSDLTGPWHVPSGLLCLEEGGCPG